MNPPFTIEEFLGVFEKYNLAVWPMQIVLYALGVLALFFAIKNIRYSDRIITAILAFFWLWIGVVYHLMYFTAVNKAAYLFGALYIIQGGIFLVAGVFTSKLRFKFRLDVYTIIGSLLIVYAMLIYPILGHLLGHSYPQSPTFGLPCPTTIFTFGMLLWTYKRVPKYVLIIPFVWSIIGFLAAISFAIKEDIGLLVAGVLGTILLLIRDRKMADSSGNGEIHHEETPAHTLYGGRL